MKFASLLQLAGLGLVGFGVFTLSIQAGIILSGIFLVLVGYSLERSA